MNALKSKTSCQKQPKNLRGWKKLVLLHEIANLRAAGNLSIEMFGNLAIVIGNVINYAKKNYEGLRGQRCKMYYCNNSRLKKNPPSSGIVQNSGIIKGQDDSTSVRGA